ncbi:hypothetical protein [Nocardioides limicola]|uniref:hypothetical protein n=1 Tax=Nocardioides limicola TaxID=2803368 RepID=UPI00193AEEF4|nr:hypothetical protein [Nocardioides sp. DJM-14]
MNAKNALIVLVAVFLGFWMFTDPSGLAEVSRTAGLAVWDGLGSVFGALISFIAELF